MAELKNQYGVPEIAEHNMKLKLTKEPVTPLADAIGALERPGRLTRC